MRLADLGYYHVTLDAAQSSIALQAGGLCSTQEVHGEVTFFVEPAVGISFTHMDLSVASFVDAGRVIDDLRLFMTNDRTHMGGTPPRPDFILNGAWTVFILGWNEGGQRRGLELAKGWGLQGSGQFDADNRTFSLDFSIMDPNSAEHETALHLAGTVDNLPPAAVAPDVSVPCVAPDATPVLLDGTNSFDPDPGDQVVRYQWFDAVLGRAVSDQAVATVTLPTGESMLRLHVYDESLASGSDLVTVRVEGPCP